MPDDNLKSVATTTNGQSLPYKIQYCCDSCSDLRPTEETNQPDGGNINIEENREEKEVSAPDDVQVGEAEADENEQDDETSAGDEIDEGQQPLLPKGDAPAPLVRFSTQNSGDDLEEVVATEPLVCKESFP